MLYDAVVRVKLPGDNPDDARARLASKLTYEHEIESLCLSGTQPPRITGTASIKLPLPGVKNGR